MKRLLIIIASLLLTACYDEVASRKQEQAESAFQQRSAQLIVSGCNKNGGISKVTTMNAYREGIRVFCNDGAIFETSRYGG